MTDRPCVVIGGGIVGAYIAYELARTGRSVVIVDPTPASGASTGNAGLLVPSYCLPMSNPATLRTGLAAVVGSDAAVSFARPVTAAMLGWLGRFVVASRPGRAMRATPDMMRMAALGVDAYEQLADRESLPLDVRRCGWLHAAESPAGLRAHVKLAHSLRRLGVRAELLTGAGARAVVPDLSAGVIGGVYFPDDAAVDPTSACAVVLTAAHKHGAQIIHASATGVTRDGDRVTAVHTTADNIAAHTVVLAAGHETHSLANKFGFSIPPIVAAHGWSLTLPTGGVSLSSTALMSVEDHVVINPGSSVVRLTGGMRFGGDPAEAPPARAFDQLRTTANRLLPRLTEIPDDGERYWGARPMTASGVPVTQRVLSNVLVAAGHGTLGMTLAPATAQWVSRQLDVESGVQ